MVMIKEHIDILMWCNALFPKVVNFQKFRFMLESISNLFLLTTNRYIYIFFEMEPRMTLTCLRLCLHTFTGFITLYGESRKKTFSSQKTSFH